MIHHHRTLDLFTDLLVHSPSGREWDLAGRVVAHLDRLGLSHRMHPSSIVLVDIEGAPSFFLNRRCIMQVDMAYMRSS